jgi:hypothetical protein
MHLQHNKVTNLRLAAGPMDRMVVRPGATLSVNRVVGNCTRRKGYVDGMRLSNGSAEVGVGGGICQLATSCTGWCCRRRSRSGSATSTASCALVVYEPGPDVEVIDRG